MKIRHDVFLSQFRVIRPRYERPQAAALEWLAAAHALAQGGGEELRLRLARLLLKLGCGPGKIDSRGHELEDFAHEEWARMRLFRLDRGAAGAPGASQRTAFFEEAVQGVMDRFYGEEDAPPADLIHVTCTGYASPSAAQNLVARRGWGSRVSVTHAYHMGCYAAIPAIRIASGLVAARSPRVDVVHTELCSLHVDPADTELETLVLETLFADGFVRYAVGPSAVGPSFRVLAARDEIVPGTEDAMQWRCGDRGMRMALSRKVPELIGGYLPEFVARLREDAGLDARERVFYAIHPGGPRIIDEVSAILGVPEEEARWSREILRTRGNMSSATLPQIWERMLDDPAVPPGAAVAGLAFGPGLSVCGCVLRKAGSS